MITDKIDGDLARKHNLITNFGKIVDPIADKAMTGMAFIGLAIIADFLPAWLWWTVTIVVLLREWGVTIARLSIAKDVVMPAKQSGKVKTVMQSVALGGFIAPVRPAHRAFEVPGDIVWWLSAVALAIAVVLTITSGWEFARDVVRHRRGAPASRAGLSPELAALAVAVGAHVLAVAAAVLAEPLGAVAGEVEHDVVAVVGGTGLEAVELAAADHVDEGHRGLDEHPGGQRRLLGDGVDVPAEVVVVDELGEGLRVEQDLVDRGHEGVLVEPPQGAQPRPQGAYGVELGRSPARIPTSRPRRGRRPGPPGSAACPRRSRRRGRC